MPEDTRARPLFAGLDVSTQSCKLVVIDPERGDVCHVDRIDYDRESKPWIDCSAGCAKRA
jgi:sugar (pentulose or hexulose) kinase